LSPTQVDYFRGSGLQAVACSQAVADMLRDRLGMRPENVQLVHDFGPVSENRDAASDRQSLRQGLNISSEAHVVLLVGSVNWRQGAYLLSSVARSLKALCGEGDFPYFIWVGEQDEGLDEGDTRRQVELEFELLGLASRLKLLGRRDDVQRFYAAADVFLLTSLEDPFPLVMMEAGAAHLPVIGFEQSGGVVEFVSADGGGITVPILDTAQMATALHRLLNDPMLRAVLGRKSRKTAGRFALENMAPRLRNLILRRREDQADRRMGLA
jgi:glycosyltransferase involved in cell wall biosynthesis